MPTVGKDKQTPVEVVREFVLKCMSYQDPVLVGIDPGSTGAIAFRCHKLYCVIDIPQVRVKVKKTRRTTYKQRKKTGRKTRVVLSTETTPDYDGIVRLFRLLKPVRGRVHVILEKIPPTIGPGRKYAEIMLNRAYAMWPLFITSKRYAGFYQERPGVWKEAMGLAGKEKEDSRHKAIALYPDADILRKKDHDRAEALLLVDYLRRLLEKAKR